MPKRSEAVSSVLARLAVSISAEATVRCAAIGRRLLYCATCKGGSGAGRLPTARHVLAVSAEAE